ncbi:alpha-amylase family glycosyl hydrolase [Candidatus Korobacter versatilis]|uniref:alpha-amylase family glycosyl hydrolase n=1 Tax=Candidatus Korobacter versatilis TaxID=658062 RepID=UPI0002E6DF8A|nr:alpha-amylase family glycosyl hydrolase [Candidatus Koribacter versatilis]
MPLHKYPSLYQVNTRATMHDLSVKLGRSATLDDVSDEYLSSLAQQGFDWVWFLGVWQTGAAARAVSRSHQEWIDEYRQTLGDFTDGDICGSCFAITAYQAHTDFGGNDALARLYKRAHQQGLRLLLDFVPNHTALDHSWLETHPDYYVAGTDEKLQHEPQNYVRLNTSQGPRIFAFGRDPYFAGWPDTLQLNYANPALQAAMRLELLNISEFCDGVRCDMAMLILPDVFERTWGMHPEPFWRKTIDAVRASKAGFLFMAEVYWDLEWTLQQEGFDYTYDKRLYDRLREGHATPVRDHLRADMEFQRKSARFLENHDEPRVAATFTPEMHRAAAIITYLCPGLRFFHDGQFEGRVKRLSVHLGRRPEESTNESIRAFYQQLLKCIHEPAIRDGQWQLLNATPAWVSNWTFESFVCFSWQADGELPFLVVVNYSDHQSQCYLQLPFDTLRSHSVSLQDLMGSAIYERVGDELLSRGLYLDTPAWGFHVFKTTI